ncbi:MAG: cisplatin damage response ATP-dependent DNA ligase [Verrucomicrobiota bacterium]
MKKEELDSETGGFTAFALLLERLLFSPSRNAKLQLLGQYFQSAPEEDRGYGLALLTGGLAIETVRAGQLRNLAKARVDESLFRWSYAYVGDLGETIALIWPEAVKDLDVASLKRRAVNLSDLVTEVKSLTPLEVFPYIDRALDGMSEVERWTFVKLVTGSSLRIGVSARLAKQGLAKAYDVDVDEIERVWSAFQPPYKPLFDWLDGDTNQPELPDEIFFHPPMLAVALEESELEDMAATDYVAEWKWDGIRVQVASDGSKQRRIFSRSGDEITSAFPDLVEHLDFRAVVDGELLVRSDVLDVGGRAEANTLPGVMADVAPFNHLQQRLNRKNVSSKLCATYPVMLCCYDLLFEDSEDLRELSFQERRERLEAWSKRTDLDASVIRISHQFTFKGWDELKELRECSRDAGLEGLMIKHKDSPYLTGRPKGHWFKWKRDPLNLDTVLIYAQRGHGKRSSFYSDYTFAVWDEGDDGARELVPVGKAYSGFTDEELVRLDKWIRDNTIERFGASVRSVKPELVLEVVFDDLQRSTRHRSGVAMRFPRIHRIRWDKPAEEADTMESVQKLMG